MRCHLCWIVALIVCVFALLLYVGSKFIPPLAPDSITIATGSKDGIYYQSALKYKELLSKERVDVKIVPTRGSVEALGLLKSGEADIAFMQSGTGERFKDEPFTSLASIYNEPIWVYYRADDKKLEYLSQLKGKRVVVGEIGSGTKELAVALLNANGVDQENTTFLNLDVKAGAQALFDNEADALFSVIGTFAPLTKALILEPKIELMNFLRQDAYDVKFSYLNSIALYEGVLDLEHNLPAEQKKLICTTATLVSTDSLHPDIIRLILQAATKVHTQSSIFREEGEFPTADRIEFVINPHAQIYLRDGDSWLEQIFPFWVASIIKRVALLLVPVLALMIPIVKIIIPAFSWHSRSKIYRWYKTLDSVNEQLDTLDKSEIKEAISKLEAELQEAKLVDVPLSYRREYYDLMEHFDMLLNKLYAKECKE